MCQICTDLDAFGWAMAPARTPWKRPPMIAILKRFPLFRIACVAPFLCRHLGLFVTTPGCIDCMINCANRVVLHPRGAAGPRSAGGAVGCVPAEGGGGGGGGGGGAGEAVSTPGNPCPWPAESLVHRGRSAAAPCAVLAWCRPVPRGHGAAWNRPADPPASFVRPAVRRAPSGRPTRRQPLSVKGTPTGCFCGPCPFSPSPRMDLAGPRRRSRALFVSPGPFCPPRTPILMRLIDLALGRTLSDIVPTHWCRAGER